MAIIGAHIIRDLPEEYKIYSEKTLHLIKSNKLTVMDYYGIKLSMLME